VTLAAEEGVVIERLGVSVKSDAVNPALSLRRNWSCRIRAWSRLRRFGTRSRAGTRGRVGCADGIGVGEQLLHAAGAFDAEISRGHLHGKGEIALHGELPGLRVADAEVGVEALVSALVRSTA